MPTNPQQIGPYRVDGVLGRGNMGIVFRGTHLESQQRVAIKTVQVASTLQQSSIRREVQSLSRLTHPGVVSIVDSGSVDAVPWYAMVLLEGKTLQSYIGTIHQSTRAVGVVDPTLTLGGADSGEWTTQNGLATATLPPKFGAGDGSEETWLPDSIDAPGGLRAMPRFAYSVRIARRLLSTLAHIHSFGVVHRDIKPANVFLVGEDEPILVDFGLSHAGATGVSREVLTATNPGAGTPAYMSPEVIRGYGIDARADIYAAGCVIFELFAGRPPFTGGTVTAILSQHMTREAPRLSHIVHGVPPSLDDALARMLHKDRRSRWGSAAEAASIFRSLEGGETEDRYGAATGRPPLYRPRLVGREDDLSLLTDDLSAAIHDSGTLRVVLGRSGSGKTYLVREAVAKTGQGAIVVPGRCAIRGAPLHPLADLLEHVADVAAGERITALLERVGAILAPFNERIAALPQRESWTAPASLEGAALRERLVSSVVDTLVTTARVQPIWLLVDDLQWADGLTLAVLHRLGSIELSDVPLAVVCTCRNEAPSAAVRGVLDVAQVLILEGIDADSVVQIVEDMLGTAVPPAWLVEHLIRSSDGSPFFVAEYLRAAHAVGAIADTEEATSLPDSLRALILRRLDTLDATSRELVDLASVLGRSLDEPVLARASALDDESLSVALSTLERLQILDASSDGELLMAHDQLQEAAYSALSEGRRSELHLRVARAIEDAHDGHLEPQYRRLARHYGIGADAESALKYERLDAESSFERLAYESAAASLERVLEPGRERMPARDRARYAQMLGECHWSLGDIPRCEKYTLQAFENLGHRLPASAVGWTVRILREASVQALHLVGIGVGTVTDPDEREDLRRMAVASNTLCWRYLFDDNIPYILALAISAANQVERASPMIPLATAHGWLGFNVGALRLHGLARRYFSKAHESARVSGDLPSAVFAILMEGLYQVGFGRFGDVIDGSSKALAMLEGEGDPQNEELHLTMLGNVAFYLGDFENSQKHFDRVHVLATQRANALHTAWGLYAKCWAMQAQGEFSRARPRLMAARDLLNDNADLASEIITYANLAFNSLQAGMLEEARADLIECADRIFKTKVANYPTAPAYGMAADVAMDLHRLRPDDAEVGKLARKLVKSTGFLTLLLPYASCIAQRVRGRQKGATAGGAALLKRAASSADRIGMRHEAALAWFELARTHGQRVPQARQEAQERLSALGCEWRLNALDERVTP